MNIKLEEVRIGNWVYDDNLCEECQVDMQIMGKIDFNQNEVVCDSGFDGIVLTREILIKSGFKTWTMDGLDYYYEQRQYEIFQIGAQNTMLPQADEWEIVYYREEPTVSRLHKTFHYVHQLQNLYFALYGEELNIVL